MTAGYLSLLTFFSLYVACRSESVLLTPDNYDEETAGKTVFIKFWVGWCGHCQALAPAWSSVATTLNSERLLMGEVDCSKYEDWCLKWQIKGFPTLLYGDPSMGGLFLEEYQDGKELADLFQFAAMELSKPICSPGNLDACDGPTKTRLRDLWSRSTEELTAATKQAEGKIALARNTFQAHFQVLQRDHDEAMLDHEQEVSGVKRELKLLKSVLALKEA